MIQQESFREDAKQLLRTWDEDDFRDNEYLRARMVCLIAEVGALVQRHATRMGSEARHGCAFQVDHFTDVLLWALVEYITDSEFDGEAREGNRNIYQLDERHAASFYDWPPALESEAQ